MITQIKRFLFVTFGIVLLLICVGVGGYMLGMQKSSSEKTQMTVSLSPTPTLAPETTNDHITTVPSGEPAEETLSLVVPASWKTINDTTSSFQISYNPILFTPKATQGVISLSTNDGKNELVYTFEKKQYDGRSRHTYITDAFGNAYTTEKTYEKSYNIDGKSALLIYNTSLPATPLIGMTPLDTSSALLITGTNTQEAYIKGILQTLRILK